MKSYKLTGIEQFGLFEEPVPIVGDNDVLIRIERVGICGSDVHYYAEGRIGSQIVAYPWTVGHEGAGTVIGVGRAVHNFDIGDRVALDPATPCFQCEQCLSGRTHTCNCLNFLGCPGQIEGCLSEYLALPSTSCLPIPSNMSLEEAALVEPLSIAVYGASLYPDLHGAVVGVLGCGPIGLSTVHVVRSAGAAAVYVTDKIDARLAAAKSAGAGWVGNVSQEGILDELRLEVPYGLDVIFECCGQQAALDFAVQALKPGGELSIIGIPATNTISFDISLLRRKEIRIQNVRRQNKCTEKAMSLISSGKVDAKTMITHRFPFAQTPEAFNLVKNYQDGVIKAMICL